MKRQYYSININGLKVKSLDPLQFEHTVLKKDVPFYQSGLLGRLITVEGSNPTNTLEEAESWLSNVAERHPDLDYLKKETVPYIDIHSITQLKEDEIKEIKGKQMKKKKHFSFK